MATVELEVETLKALIGGQTNITNTGSAPSLLTPFTGQTVVIRTVTMIVCGRYMSSDGTFIAVTDAAWIADSGRWADALKSGEFAEVEPFPSGTVLVGIGGVIDITTIPSLPPRSQK